MMARRNALSFGSAARWTRAPVLVGGPANEVVVDIVVEVPAGLATGVPVEPVEECLLAAA